MDYLISISPIVICHFLVPPLSHYNGTEELYSPELNFLYELVPEELRPSTIRNDFKNQKKWIAEIEKLMYDQSMPLDSIQVITHMFIHADSIHLFNNVSCLLFGGYRVYKKLGIFGLYATFFIGGISAVIPTTLYKIQRDTQVVQVVTSRTRNKLPKSILSWVDKPLQAVAKKVAEVYDKCIPVRMAGSSYGVCAVLSCDTILAIRDASKSLLKVYKSIPLTFEEENALLFEFVGCTFSTLLHFSNKINMIYGDWILHSVINTSVLHSINHAAHVQGSLAGIAFGIVFGVAIPYIQRNVHLI